MRTRTTKFDAARYLNDEATIAQYLEACLEEGGLPLYLLACEDAARARRRIASQTIPDDPHRDASLNPGVATPLPGD